jgi:hypothetical protein
MFRTNPGTWKPAVFWERTYAESAHNSTNPPKVAEHRLMRSLMESPEQLGCVPGSEHYLNSVSASRRDANLLEIEGLFT